MRLLHKYIAFLLVLTSLFSCVGISALAAEEASAEPLTDIVRPEEINPEELTEEDVSLETEEQEETASEDISAEEAPAEEETPVQDEASAEEEIPAEEDTPAAEEETLPEEEPAYHWAEPGSSDEDILGGGTMLSAGDRFYYSEDGIWLEMNGSTYYISDDSGRNLNLVNGWLYYTVGGSVIRVPMDGGTAETVSTVDETIDTLFVMDWELRYLAGDTLYSHDLRDSALTTSAAPQGALGFLPTEYGNIFLCGAPRDYALVVNGQTLAYGIRFCHTVDGWLVIDSEAGMKQVALADLFEGIYAPAEYMLYDDMVQGLANNGLTDEEQLANEAAFMSSEQYLVMMDGTDMYASTDGLYYVGSNSDIAYLANDLSANQTNIVLRARQMAEVEWTPLKDRYSWGGNDSSYVNNNTYGSSVVSTDGTKTAGYFKAGETYRGVPYAQAVYTGYVGWDLSLSYFVKAVNNSSSEFYTGYSKYSRTAPYYGSDCSGFVSWAWQTPYRRTCTSLLQDSKYIGRSVNLLKVGDSLNNPNSHVVLVTDIGYDSRGNIVAVEITEQTPAKMRVTCYGEQIPGKYYDNVRSLSSLTSYYFNGGYSIYRRYLATDVSYTPSDAVDLDKGGYAPAPRVSVSVNAAGNAKVVTLSHVNSSATIYYTIDGSAPSASGIKYTGPFEVTKDTTVRAVADCGSTYSGYHTVTYAITVSKAQSPFLALVEGDMDASAGTTAYVSSGTKIALINEDMDTVYYTTDGTTPTVNSKKMPMEGITVSGNMTLKAVASSDEHLNSNVVTIKVVIDTFHIITATATEGGIISPSGPTGVRDGADYTFAIVPDDYFQIGDVKVDGVSVGSVDSYTFKDVDKAHTIAVTFSIDVPFTDVGDQWYTDSVHFVYSRGLFSGVTQTKFMPNDNMTRGMFITVLGRFARAGTDLESWSGTLGITNGTSICVRGKTSTSDTSQILATTGLTGEHISVVNKISPSSSLDNNTWYRVNYSGTTGFIRESTVNNDKILLYVYSGNFQDLPNGKYYTGYAQWGNAMGIVQGYGDGRFGPDYYISRQDICVLMYRYLTEYMSYDLSSTTTTFKDDSSIADYAKTAVYAMKKIGVVNGYQDGNFYPNFYATRAEVATMFANLYRWINS